MPVHRKRGFGRQIRLVRQKLRQILALLAVFALCIAQRIGNHLAKLRFFRNKESHYSFPSGEGVKINTYLGAVTGLVLLVSGCTAPEILPHKKAGYSERASDCHYAALLGVPTNQEGNGTCAGVCGFFTASSKIFLFGFGSGYGVVKDLKHPRYTYMRMVQGERDWAWA